MPAFGVHIGNGVFGIGDPQEVEKEWQRVPHALVLTYQGPGDLLARYLRIVVRIDAKVTLQELDNGRERDRSPIRNAARPVHVDAARSAPLCELDAKATLPDSGLAHHRNDLTLPFHRVRQCMLELLHLFLPTHEAGESARARDVETASLGTHVLELVDPKRLLRPLELEFAQVG